MINNDDYILIDCFYYSFYIKKDELHKYNISENTLKESNKISSMYSTSKYKNYKKINEICIDINNFMYNSYPTEKLSNSRLYRLTSVINFIYKKIYRYIYDK
tara:strand:- start:441 stop:746 length:306 start_codon:yes stop_codon:yes gene_type:complete